MNPSNHTRFRERYGPWVLIAGASVGMGAEFATQLAARKLNLVLVARRVDEMQSLAAKLASTYGIQTQTIPLDLSRSDAAAVIAEQTRDVDLGLLIYNAGYSVVGPFFDTALENHLRELDTNCRTPLALSYNIGQRMLGRKRGGIVLISSLSAMQGSALIANYVATKAYELLLAEGLWDELREHGIDVLASMPSSIATPTYLASHPKQSPMGTLSPQDVVTETLGALGKQSSIVPGRSNRFTAFFMRRLLPRQLAITIMGRTMRGMHPRNVKDA